MTHRLRFHQRCLWLLIPVLAGMFLTGPGRAAQATPKTPLDFSAIQQGLRDGTFVPIAFQRPNCLLEETGGIFSVGNVRWNVVPRAKTPWYDVPHQYATVRIDPRKARQVLLGRQTVSPLFLHAFMVITFADGGVTCNGKSSQGLVLTVEPLLRHDQHHWTTPIVMFKGRYPRVLQLTSWENFAVFTGEIMKQMAWLRPLKSSDPQVARRMTEAFIRHATASPAAQPFDWKTHNCAASLFPIIRDGLPPAESQHLGDILAASSKPTFSRWFEKHLRAAGVMDETKALRLFHQNFFIPLSELLKKAGMLASSGT